MAGETARRGALFQALAGLALAVGVWLVVAPWVLAYPMSEDGVDAKGREIVLGIGVALVAFSLARRSPRLGVPWVLLLVLGGCLVLVPIVLGDDDAALRVARMSDLVSGLILLALALLLPLARRRAT